MNAAKRPRRYEQIIDNEWFRSTLKGYEMCCDCQMVHWVEYRMKDDGLWIKKRVVRRGKPCRKVGHAAR